MTFARAAASAAMANKDQSEVPLGNRWTTAEPSPWTATAFTTNPRASTKARNGTSIAAATSRTATRRRAKAGTPRAAAPPSAANAGLTWKSESTKNPASVSITTLEAKRGTGRRDGASFSPWPTRSAAKKRRSTTHSTATAVSQGRAMVAPKRPKERPLAR